MDRILRVMKDGCELAELKYNYTAVSSGKVMIKINRIYDLGDDMKSSYPIFEYEMYFDHGRFTELDQLTAFDKELLKKQNDFNEEASGTLEYLYEPIEYRYLIKHREAVGIAEIKADFYGNSRELKFLSARRQKEDISLSSSTFESNNALLKRLCEEYLDCYGADFIGIGWN